MSESFQNEYRSRLAYSVDAFTNCVHEPIERCGAIQAQGYFLSLRRSDLSVVGASENLLELLALRPEQIFGKPAGRILRLKNGDPLEVETIQVLLHQPYPRLLLPNDSELVASLHSADDVCCLDLESVPVATELKPQIHNLISRLEGHGELESDTEMVCDSIRELAGFDRVMIYRFESNWDGVVIAESKIETLEPFLHLRYPASDIPEQARRLYLNSRYRMIVDTQALPIAVLAQSGMARSEVDMSCSVLRASSPVHIQYLQNMGVRSSFSVPIKVHGKLWGLISCHHSSAPLYLAPDLRASLELVGRILSGRVINHMERRRLQSRSLSLSFTQSFLSNLALGNEPVTAFERSEAQLAALIQSGGVYMRVQGREAILGRCPPPAFVELLKKKLSEETNFVVWKSENLRETLGLQATQPEAAGALAIPLSVSFEDLIIWFRPEAVQEVLWGGKPVKPVNSLGKLEPCESFAAWAETVRDRCSPWTEDDEESAQFILFNFVKDIFLKAAALATANRELERIARAKDEFIGMVSHELRTPLSVIIGWLDILRYSISNIGTETEEALEVIERNAKLQVSLINDLLDISRIIAGKLRINLQSNVQIDQLLQDVVDSLKPTAQAKAILIRCHIEAPLAVVVDSERMRQMVWNLVTNAIKFTPKGGQVNLNLTLKNSWYQITVSDSGIGLESKDLRAVFDRFQQVEGGRNSSGGLGLGLSIVKALTELHGGRVEASSEGLGKGSQFTLALPIFALKSDDVSESEPQIPKSMPNRLTGRRVLLAEDQEDSAVALRFLVERLGGTCVVVSNGQAALQKLLAEPFDLILSDVGMPELDGHELLKRWRDHERQQKLPQIPAIALTAYASSKDRTRSLESGFQSHVPKPVDKAELIAVMESLGFRN